jgi:GDPmannose 4,6-dehydratase
MTKDKVALICGIHGQDGSYLAKFLIEKGYEVYGTTRNINTPSTYNLSKLDISNKVKVLQMFPEDIKSVIDVFNKSNPDEVYYLAGQSSVAVSFIEPKETIESIVMGTLNMLEACRDAKKEIRFYQAGSSECFGDTLGAPANEETPFLPKSPYGVAKSSAFWLVNNYRESYNMFACTGILFNHESPLRPSTFVTQKIISTANKIAKGSSELLTLGRLDIKRDWGWAPEYIKAMWLMLQQDEPDDFVIATGKSYSLEDFVRLTFSAYGLDWKNHVIFSEEFSRPSDLNVSIADPSRAGKKLGWKAEIDMPEVITKMLSGNL